MILWKSVFESVAGDGGVWKLAFPSQEMRHRPLFATYDTYGSHLPCMAHTLQLTGQQWNDQSFTEALLDFDLEGYWLMQLRGSRWTETECRIRFERIHDADMFKMFGVLGTVTEKQGVPGTIGFDMLADNATESFRL